MWDAFEKQTGGEGRLMKTASMAAVISMVIVCPLLFGAVGTTGEGLRQVGDYLVSHQMQTGDDTGGWPEELVFTGAIAGGLAAAYGHTCECSYGMAAVSGGVLVELYAGGYYGYGDEAYLIALISCVIETSLPNLWTEALAEFYENVRLGEGGTPGFIAYYETGTEPSTAVYYLAMHAVAAHMVDATDKAIWRQAVSEYLSHVNDDTAEWPVMALGVATWALAHTGPLDATLVDPDETGEVIWQDVALADLPGLLLSHQVPEGSGCASGSFYWRFDHTAAGGPPPGYGFTEDTVFAAIGLAEAAAHYDLPLVRQGVARARGALLRGIREDGSVWGHLCEDSPPRFLYAGEMLLALSELVVPGDLDLNDRVDLLDLAELSRCWKADTSGCECGRADLDGDSAIDLDDLMILAKYWLAE
jgi:hypothetical protein